MMFSDEFNNPVAVGAMAELVHLNHGYGDGDDRSTNTSLRQVESVKVRKIEWLEP